MCKGCFEEYGGPTVVNDKVRRAALLVQSIYSHPSGGVGGNMHVHLDDWNLEDEFFEEEALNQSYHPGAPPEYLQTERDCYSLMRTMTLEERAAAIGLQRGYFAPPPTSERSE